VIRPRFADAKFFFDEDLKQGLASMGDGLKTVTYQAKLGSVADKVARVAALAEAIAPQVGVDAALARRARSWPRPTCRAAWSTSSRNCRASPAATTRTRCRRTGRGRAGGIDEAYMPRFAGDDIALSKLGQGAGDRRAPRHARRRVCRGPEAHRQQGSVRPAAQCAGPGAHDHRERASTST
jgi:glycyl-tRNA synthetase beta chain